MAEEKESTSPNLTKFPNAEKANSEIPTQLPGAFDLFKPSLAAIRRNLEAFLLLAGLPMLLVLIGQGSNMFAAPTADTGMTIFDDGAFGMIGTIGALLALLTAPAVILLQLKGSRNETISWGDAFSEGLKHFWRFLGLAILSALMLGVAFILLIVPFFLLLPRIALAVYYLIDKNMGVIEALKASMQDYKAHKGVWGIIGVCVILGLAGLIPLIGSIASSLLLFLYGVAPAIRYLQIAALKDGKPPRTPIEAEPAT